jgi:hypothetical protein
MALYVKTTRFVIQIIGMFNSQLFKLHPPFQEDNVCGKTGNLFKSAGLKISTLPLKIPGPIKAATSKMHVLAAAMVNAVSQSSE